MNLKISYRTCLSLLSTVAVVAILGSGVIPWQSLEAATTDVPAEPDATKADLSAADAAKAAASAIKKTELTNFDFWRVQCDQYVDANLGRKCIGRLPVFKQNSQQLVAVLMIMQNDAEEWQLKLVIPTSLYVSDGGNMSFDGSDAKPMPFAIETCEPAGCSSSLPLSAELVALLKASTKVSLSWNGLDKKPIKVDFEIKGIKQALKALLG